MSPLSYNLGKMTPEVGQAGQVVSNKKDKTQHLLRFSLFCILATGLVVTIFYLTMDKSTSSSKGVQCIIDFIGDGFCDDNLNAEVCNWDDGDCCLPTIQKTNCFECFCHYTGEYHDQAPDDCNWKRVGDGKCDGINNRPQCNYDDRDCCLVLIDGSSCTGDECKCHETNSIHAKMPS